MLSEKQFFQKVQKKVKRADTRVLSRGEVNMVKFGYSAGWSIEKTVGKVYQGHGERWV